MQTFGRRNADYGFDGSYHTAPPTGQAAIIGAGSAALLASAVRSLGRGKPVAAGVAGATGAAILASAALFVRTTRVGKFEVWARLLDDLELRGDETLLDLGCGRGALLLAAGSCCRGGAPSAWTCGVPIRPTTRRRTLWRTLRSRRPPTS